jgi:hypothetical protein
MTLSERLEELVRAAFAGVWVRTHEPEDALLELHELARRHGWKLAAWDIDQGLHVWGQPDSEVSPATDPLSVLKAVGALHDPDGSGVVLLALKNYHRFLASPEVVQALHNGIGKGKLNSDYILVLAPSVQIPPELERDFVVVEHELPGRDQLDRIARSIATEPGELPEGDDLSLVLDAASGLTRNEAENAFSLSIVRHGRIVPETLWELKTQALKKSGLLTLHRGVEKFADLGGLEALKAFTRRALGNRRGSVRARGVLLLGVPGTGKSAMAKALGNETGRPTLVMDVGALMGSLVGQTEERTRQALKIVDAMAPAVLFIDEIEKALSGVQSSSDSGVSTRLFGTFLSWLSDHESDVFVVATSNDVSKLPPEFSRAERWDGTFFLDLPGRKEKDSIWRLYMEKYGLDPEQYWPLDEGWTGAEVKAACRLSALLDIPLVESAENIVPVAVSAGESVERLRNWASGRCLSADRPGVYVRNSSGPRPTGNWSHIDPSLN